MKIEYRRYQRDSLKAEPEVIFIKEWRIHYLGFCQEGMEDRLPLVVLGGAFQNFNSYKFCVEHMLEDRPVILIDLPSLGDNHQLAPELKGEDLSDLLNEFFLAVELPKADLMGLSLGSVVASTFAYKYPDFVGRLIVAGIIPQPRKSWRMLIEESIRVLDEKRMDEFAQAAVLCLINYGRLEETGISSTARRLFVRQMARMNENEQARYKINAARILDVESIVGYPQCETLVTTGEFDSFTLPHENAEFAAQCPNSKFVLIEGADHLPQLERRDVSLNMFAAFLRGENLSEVAGLRIMPRGTYENLERRIELRRIPSNPKARITAESTIGEAHRIDRQVRIVDINFHGCLLQLEERGLSLAEHTRDLTLEILSPQFSRDLLVFQYDNSGMMRCLFKHGNIKEAEQFADLLKNSEYFYLPEEKESPRQKLHKIY